MYKQQGVMVSSALGRIYCKQSSESYIHAMTTGVYVVIKYGRQQPEVYI